MSRLYDSFEHSFIYSGELTRKCTLAGLWDKTINSRNCKQAELEEIKDVSFFFFKYTEHFLKT